MQDIFTHITDYLWTQSWHIAVLVIVLATATFALKNKSAHVRYLLWLILLAKCLVPAFITIPLAILPAKDTAPAPLYQPPAALAPTPAPVYSEPLYEPAAPLVYEMSEAEEPSVFAKLADITLSQWLAAVWLAGIVLFLIIASAKALRANRWLKKHRIPLPAELAADIARLFENLRLRSPPRVWLIAKMSQPFVFGALRGHIYLPANFTQIDTEKGRRGVLGHELSHVLRFDAAINLLQILAQAIFWFHPFVWWANKRIRAEREKCCDEMALATLDAKAKDYSSAIVNALLAEHTSRIPVPSLAIAGPVKNIEDRIKTIMAPNKKFYKRPGLIAIISALLIAAVAVPTTLALTHRQPPETPNPQTELTPQPSDPNSITAEAEPEKAFPVQFLSTVTVIEIPEGSLLYGYPPIQSLDKHTPILNADELAAFLELLPTDTRARVLARPKLLTNDGQEGTIYLISSEEYISGYKEPESGYGEPVPIQKRFGEWQMRLTAHHPRAGDTVRVELELEYNQLLEFKQELYKNKYPYQVPMMTSKTIATTVAMESGQTTVLAGTTFNSKGVDMRLLTLVTCEEIQHRMVSARKLMELGREIFVYAAEHDGKLPHILDGHTIARLDVIWYVMNVTYLGAGLTATVPGNTPIAYDKTLLEKIYNTNVLYADGNVDFIGKAALDKLLANPLVQPWRQAFDAVYRLRDGEMLKRIPPPFIPERVDYYQVELGWSAEHMERMPAYFTFHWEDKLIWWGMGLSDSGSIKSILGTHLNMGRFEYDVPAEMDDIKLPGDWIVRTSADKAQLLKALEAIVHQMTGRDIRFVGRQVERDVIVATGSSSSRKRDIDIYVDALGDNYPGGGGSGTVAELLEHVADVINIPVIDRTEPTAGRIGWRNHRSASFSRFEQDDADYEFRVDMLLQRLTDQTGLRFKRSRAVVTKWFVVEGNKEPAPQYNPNIGGYRSYSPEAVVTPGAPQIQFPNNSDEMAATYSPPQPPPDSNFTDLMNTLSPSEFVNMVYDVSILLQPWGTSQLPPRAAAASPNTAGAGGYGVIAPQLPYQQDSVRSIAQQLMDEIQTTIDPNTWFDNGGKGTITLFHGTKLVVRQTPNVHRKIDEFLRNARSQIRQVSIEARFIRAPQTILRTAGVLLDDANTIDLEASLSDPNALTEISTLRKIKCSATTLSDADTDALIRTTQATRAAKTLIAPKVTVLNGEAALLHAVKATPYISPLHTSRDTFGPVAAQTPPSPPEDGPLNQLVRHRNYGTVANVLPTIASDNTYIDMEMTITVSNLLGYRPLTTQRLGNNGEVVNETTQFPKIAAVDIEGFARVPAGRTLLITAPPEAVNHVYGSGPYQPLAAIGDTQAAESEAADSQVLLILIKPAAVAPEGVEPLRNAP